MDYKTEEIKEQAKEIIFDYDVIGFDINCNNTYRNASYTVNTVDTGYFNVDNARSFSGLDEGSKDRVSIDFDRQGDGSIDISLVCWDRDDNAHHAGVTLNTQEQVDEFTKQIQQQFEMAQAVKEVRGEFAEETGSSSHPEAECNLPTFEQRMLVETGDFYWNGFEIVPTSKDMPEHSKGRHGKAYYHHLRNKGDKTSSAAICLENLYDKDNEYAEILLNMRGDQAAVYNVNSRKVRKTEGDRRQFEVKTFINMQDGTTKVLDGEFYESRGRLIETYDSKYNNWSNNE